MGLSAADIAGVIKEVAPAVVGGWIQKVYQPYPRTVTLDIRTPGQTVSLLISADPENARLHLLRYVIPILLCHHPFASI